ncbi:UDP-glucose--hexose-1-phosphate uridylyltransferase [Paenibacillus psychroresistens]|uniref:Galactose-1-phosphate uridylyltransferase n=1 Tax=Paenibacillus psychroresistens TaxID=1778678 RepID=A0A6B8RWB3_9BACL|nr:UDP-glucose--hexose-1-phosphate uridylyltransferase [Paenibacillus psychroresistens]
MSQEPNNTDNDIKLNIAKLVQFALNQQLLEHWDVVSATNALLDLLGVAEPYSEELLESNEKSAVDILSHILDYAVEQGILQDNNTTLRDLLDAKIMGLLMPRQSEVIRKFWQTVEEESIQKATELYYQLSIDSNYIRMDRIAKNLYWQTATEYGSLEITVNLSKPEKDPKEIALERSLPQSSYPKCLLCYENVGYAGRLNHPARQNHRVIPLQLDGSTWFLQYSPYVYYNEHSIIFCEQHTPMKISQHTFTRLLDFVGQFPHYFIGSNADLPIVGGSILNHDHFQGGRHSFPMEKAGVLASFSISEYPQVKMGIVKWPMSVIRISSKDPQDLILLATRIYEAWQGYSDPAAEVQSESKVDGVLTPHNTVTPIARMNGAAEYELDLVLRNNRTTDEQPFGIFHPHEPLHHIKKENIGLIEVMGLAVLPGRLQNEMQQIEQILTGELIFDSVILENTQHVLYKHKTWIEELIKEYGISHSDQSAQDLVRNEVGNKFLAVLSDAGVYKNDPIGLEAFHRFMLHLGCKVGI